MSKTIKCIVNKRLYELVVEEGESLLEMLRERLELTGDKQGCGVGECGACSVIVDGSVLDSCIYLAAWVDGKEITTIEGVQDESGSLSDLQRNFVDLGAVQCGFCTPGLVLSATAFLNKNPDPTREEIRRGLSGNLCRCTGYQKVLEAVEKTAEERNLERVSKRG